MLDKIPCRGMGIVSSIRPMWSLERSTVLELTSVQSAVRWHKSRAVDGIFARIDGRLRSFTRRYLPSPGVLALVAQDNHLCATPTVSLEAAEKRCDRVSRSNIGGSEIRWPSRNTMEIFFTHTGPGERLRGMGNKTRQVRWHSSTRTRKTSSTDGRWVH